MAIWLGGSVIAPIGVRRTLALGQPHTRGLVPRLEAMTNVMIGAALLTVATGIGLVAAYGGTAAVPARILVGAALTPLVFFVGGVFTRPTLKRLGVLFEGGGSSEVAAPLVARFFALINIELAVRLAV